MRGRVGNREITIIAKTNIFYKLIWIPLSFKDKEGEENWRRYKGNSFFWQNRLNKNSTWILNWKFHYIFLLSDRAHSKTKNNWTKCRPFQEGMFYSIVWFTQAKHCKRDAPISKRPSAWDIFSQSHAAHVPLPVTLLSVHSSYTPFRNTNKFEIYHCLWHKTWMQEQFLYTWDHHKHSLEHEMWSFQERRQSWEKSFHLPLEKSKPSAHRSLLWMPKFRSGF